MSESGSRVWTRRRVLGAAGLSVGAGVLHGSGAHLWAAETRAACTLTPELEVGPYYLPYELMRRDIREGKPGIPMLLEVELRNATTCEPLANAAIDVWHCDALGIYSGFTKVPADMFMGGPLPELPGGPPPPHGIDDRHTPPPGGPGGPGREGGPPPMQQTDKETFFRGVQLTDAHGRVQFDTIYPGWYVSRDTHIHMEVHLGGHVQPHAAHAFHAAKTETGKYEGGHVCHIGQIAFPDELSDRIAKFEPYRQHKVKRTRLAEDMVFHDEAKNVMISIQPMNAAALQQGFRGRVVVFVDPAVTAHDVQRGPGGRPPGPPPGAGKYTDGKASL